MFLNKKYKTNRKNIFLKIKEKRSVIYTLISCNPLSLSPQFSFLSSKPHLEFISPIHLYIYILYTDSKENEDRNINK